MNGEEVRLESTLATVARDCDSAAQYKCCVFAVIIDASPPLKTEKYSNYFTLLKVIDPSFNYRTPPAARGLVFYKQVDVYIYSESPAEAPRVRCVGDIIRMRRFRYKLRKNGDMRGYARKDSNWDVFGGQQDEPFEALCSRRGVGRCAPLSAMHVGRLADLRYWSDHFFFSSYLRFVTWWRGTAVVAGGEPAPDARDERHRDLVLRCTAVDVPGRSMSFHNPDGLAFRLEVDSRPTLAPGAAVQLRDVDVHWRSEGGGWTGHIRLTIYSSCLLLPPFSCDYRALARLPLKDGAPAPPRPSLELFQPYALGGAPGPSLTAFRPGADLGARSSAAELRRLLADEPQKHIAKKFLVEVQIAGFHSLEPAAIVRRYYPFEKQAVGLDQPVVPGKRSRVMYSLLAYVVDPGEAEQLPVYIVSNENEFYLFDSWRVLPRSEDTSAWSFLGAEDFAPFVQKLRALCGARLALLVQLTLTTTHKYFFKLTDTVFLPFD